MSNDKKLIVALDFESTEQAQHLVTQLDDSVEFYKIGLELAYNGGLELACDLKQKGKKIFIDLKLHDIGTTVERATRQISKQGFDFLTVHAYPQTMEAARQGVEGNLKLLAVTVMTSYNDNDLALAGYAAGVQETVVKRAMQAYHFGIHGLILSPVELQSIRPIVGPDMILVTPGIRPKTVTSEVDDLIDKWHNDPKGLTLNEYLGMTPEEYTHWVQSPNSNRLTNDDQKRVMTPREAVGNSANHIVVGRPITRATNPRAVAEQIQREIEEEDNVKL